VSAGRQSRAGRYWRLHALRLVPNSVSDLLILVLFRRQELRPGTVQYALWGVAWCRCPFFGSFP
jgi:hypothetical protein